MYSVGIRYAAVIRKPVKIGGNPKDFSNNKALICTSIGFGNMNKDNIEGSKGYMIDTNVRYGKTACKLHDR